MSRRCDQSVVDQLMFFIEISRFFGEAIKGEIVLHSGVFSRVGQTRCLYGKETPD